MPSTLPGMDPYVESPDWFPCLHDCLIFGILESLQLRLPESYYAQSTQRVWLEVTHRSVEPDIDVIHSGGRPSRWQVDEGGVAVAEEVDLAEPVLVSVEAVEHDPFEEPFIEIRRRQSNGVRLVASIEVVSLANKTPGNPGREKYLAKQAEILTGQAHLIEIDLLRDGTGRTQRPSLASWPSRRPVRSITTSASTASIGPTTSPSIPSGWSSGFRALPSRFCPVIPTSHWRCRPSLTELTAPARTAAPSTMARIGSSRRFAPSSSNG